MKIASAIRRFSPTLPAYLFVGVFLVRLIDLDRLAKSPLFLPGRGDMHFYNDWAQRIVRGELTDHGAFYGLPLYPYLIASLYKVFGYNPFIPGILQSLLDAGTAVLIYWLVLSLFSVDKPFGGAWRPASKTHAKWFAAGAALAWGFYVPAQGYSIILMPTAAFIFLFWLIVWRISGKEKALGWKECLVFGLLIGVAAMAIASSLFLVPLVLAALLLKPSANWKAALFPNAAVLFLGIGIGTSPCWIHNYFVARDPVFLSAHGGVNFWIGNNPTANGYPRFPPGLRAGQAVMLEDSITSAESAVGRPLKRAEVSAYWSRQAKSYIAQHFGEWLRLLLVKLRNFWNAFQYDDLSIITNLREQRIIFPGLYFGLVAALALPGMLIAWWIAPTSRWISAAIALQMIALLTVFITERYRLVVVPGLIILAAYGLSIFWRSLSENRYRPALVYVALLCLSAIFVSWPQRNPSLWALDAYNSGWQALESGQLALAEQKLALAQRYVPGNPETNFALGNLRLAQGNSKAATEFYLATLKYDDKHRGALNNLAVMALDDNRYDWAEMWLRRAESVDQQNPKTHFLLAKALLARGDRSSAQLELDLALKLRPEQREFRQLKQQLETNSP